jgi:hypothetical protein
MERIWEEEAVAEFRVLSRHLPKETEVNDKRDMNIDSPCRGRDSNKALLEIQLEALPLDPPGKYMQYV